MTRFNKGCLLHLSTSFHTPLVFAEVRTSPVSTWNVPFTWSKQWFGLQIFRLLDCTLLFGLRIVVFTWLDTFIWTADFPFTWLDTLIWTADFPFTWLDTLIWTANIPFTWLDTLIWTEYCSVYFNGHTYLDCRLFCLLNWTHLSRPKFVLFCWLDTRIWLWIVLFTWLDTRIWTADCSVY
jgi:hypothetical protein